MMFLMREINYLLIDMKIKYEIKFIFLFFVYLYVDINFLTKNNKNEFKRF